MATFRSSDLMILKNPRVTSDNSCATENIKPDIVVVQRGMNGSISNIGSIVFGAPIDCKLRAIPRACSEWVIPTEACIINVPATRRPSALLHNEREGTACLCRLQCERCAQEHLLRISSRWGAMSCGRERDEFEALAMRVVDGGIASADHY
jgi:hypothetical protein